MKTPPNRQVEIANLRASIAYVDRYIVHILRCALGPQCLVGGLAGHQAELDDLVRSKKVYQAELAKLLEEDTP